MIKIIIKNFVMFIILISTTILAEDHPSAFAYLSPLQNSTIPSATNPTATQHYPPCPPNYSPANFPCTITVGNYTKVIGAPEGGLNQSSVAPPAVPEFGSLASMIIAISIFAVVAISRRFKFHSGIDTFNFSLGKMFAI